MKKILASIAFLLTLTTGELRAQTPNGGPANIANILYASNFAQWRVPQGNNGPFSWSYSSACTGASSGGVDFKPFVVGSPITIYDTATPNNSEVVTVTAVSILGSGCTITTTTPAHTHYNFFLSTATAGLQEAINYSNQTTGTSSPAAVVAVTPAWSILGGITSMVVNAKGNTAISILDLRSAVLVPYTWSTGSSVYVPQPFGSTGVSQLLAGAGISVNGGAGPATGPVTVVNTAPLTAVGLQSTFATTPFSINTTTCTDMASVGSQGILYSGTTNGTPICSNQVTISGSILAGYPTNGDGAYWQLDASDGSAYLANGNFTIDGVGNTVIEGTLTTQMIDAQGIDAGNNQITGVANGISSTDAAAFGQRASTKSAVAHNFLTAYTEGTPGTFTQAQPAFADISGNIAVSQMNSGTAASTSTFWRGDGTWVAVPSSMVYCGAGICNSTGTAYGTSYSSTNTIPANFISTLNQNTTGTASNLSGTPALPNGTTATTQTTGDATLKVATDQFVQAATSALTSSLTSVALGTNASGVIQAATSKELATPMVTAALASMRAQAFGDSMSYGTGATNPAGFQDLAYGWANQVGPVFGVLVSNYAIGGFTSVDINNLQVNVKPSPVAGSLYFIDSGFTNDTEEFGSNSNWQLIAQRAEQGSLYRLLIPDSAKNFMQTATLAGGFALDGVTYHASQGIVSSTNGATASTTVTVTSSGVLEGCYMVYNGGTATFTLAVGGVNQTDPISGSTTWINGGDGSQAITGLGGGSTQFCAGFRISGLTAGSKTVLITQTAAGATPKVNIQWLGSPAASSSTNPTVMEMDVPQLASSAPNFGSTGLYQTILTNIAANATTDAQNLDILGARAALGANPGSSGYFSGDGIHPSSLGYSLITALAVTQGTTAGIVTGTPVVLGGQSAQLLQPITTDVSSGFSLNPANNNGNGGWGGLTTYFLSKGNAAWSGTGAGSGAAEGMVFGQIVGFQDYNFCYYTQNSNPSNYTYVPSNVLGCDIRVKGGNVDFGTSATSLAQVRVNASQTTFNADNAGGIFIDGEQTFLQPTSSRSGTNNITSPEIDWVAFRTLGSSTANASAGLKMVLPSTGNNAQAVLTATAANGPINVDLTAWTQISAPTMIAPAYETTVGTAIASATTIAPVTALFHVTGTATIQTITPPAGMSSTIGGCLDIIADGAWSTNTSGNIFASMTAVSGTPYRACYDGSKWYIK